MGKKPKALLINPPIYDFALYDLYLKPYGLFRIGTWLKSCGWEVAYCNFLDYTDGTSSETLGRPKRKGDGTGKFHRSIIARPEGLEGINRNYARYGIVPDAAEGRMKNAFTEEGETSRGPDAVFITAGMTYWYPGVRETVRLVRRTFPGAPVFIGGIYPSLLPDHAAGECGADYIVTGDAWERGALPGILKKLRFPAAAPPVLYPDEDAAAVCGDSGVLELSRGCPFSCTYCASRFLCSDFVEGEPVEAFAYFKSLYKRGIRNYAFYDDALLYKKEEVLFPFLRMVAEEGHNPRFFTPNAVHLRYIDDETAVVLKKSGFQEVRLGFESADGGFHGRYDRKFTIESFGDRIRALNEAGFSSKQLRVYVLAGLPKQRAEEVEDSLHYARKAGVQVMLARYSPVPGTALWKSSLENSRYPLADEPLYHNNTFFPMEWERFTRGDLQRLQDVAVALNRKVLTG